MTQLPILKKTMPIRLWPIWLALIISTASFGQEQTAVDFATDIQPLLARKCYACHGPDKQESSLRFDDRTTVVGQADSGAGYCAKPTR